MGETITKYFLVPSGATATQVVTKSGNIHTPADGVITNVAP